MEDSVVRNISSARCNDLVMSWDLAEDEKNELIRELPSHEVLCPNITDFEVSGAQWLSTAYL